MICSPCSNNHLFFVALIHSLPLFFIHGLTTTSSPSYTSHQAFIRPITTSILPARRHSYCKPLQESNTIASSSPDSSSSTEQQKQNQQQQYPLKGLKIGIIGGGPSGLLLSHRLLQKGASSISIFETRNDPRHLNPDKLSGRAYALGVGIRGRRAIRSGIDEELWNAVKERGYQSDRFTLCISPKIKVKLRDGPKKTTRFWRRRDRDRKQEPSLLMYQSDLCSVLLEELEQRQKKGMIEGREGIGELELYFGTKVINVDIPSRTIQTMDPITKKDDKQQEEEKITTTYGPFDLLVGCDGVNSPVRTAIQNTAPPNTFTSLVKNLPGEFKVARLSSMPPNLDPTSVSLLLPTKGKVTAFVEPTVNNGACVLFAGRDVQDDPILSSQSNVTELLTMEHLTARFPLLHGIKGMKSTSTGYNIDVIQQLTSQRSASASSVKCNIYHYDCAVLCGDAAHATGGVSGNGLNSALLDSIVLSQCLESTYTPNNKIASIQDALLSYSIKQVPEGLALYDLAFGSTGELNLIQRLSFLVANILNFVFGGKFGIGQPQLQVQLASSSQSFVSIRRDREYAYSEKFPEDEVFRTSLTELYKMKEEDETQ